MMLYLDYTIKSLENLLGPNISSTALLSSLDFLNNWLIDSLIKASKFNANYLVTLKNDI